MKKIVNNNYQALFISPTPAISPLLQAQGIPHIKELSRFGIQFTLLTLESPIWSNSEWDAAKKLKCELEEHNIEWVILRSSKTPFIPKSTIDIFRGALVALQIVLKKRIKVIHVRSYLPAFMVLLIKKIVDVKFIFDMRGFLPDEYVESGHWSKASWQYRLSKNLEVKCFNSADSIVTTCSEMRDLLYKSLDQRKISRKLIDGKIAVVENCTNLSKFKNVFLKKTEMRARYNLDNNFVLLWLVGGIASWHMPKEICNFFKIVKEIIPHAKLLILTHTESAEDILKKNGLVSNDYLIIKAPPAEVGNFIAMGDVGLSFLDPGHPASAVKVAEYLACGLQVVVDAYQRTIAQMLRSTETGIVIEDFSSQSYSIGAKQLLNLNVFEDKGKNRSIDVAEKYFSLGIAVEKYHNIYSNIMLN